MPRPDRVIPHNGNIPAEDADGSQLVSLDSVERDGKRGGVVGRPGLQVRTERRVEFRVPVPSGRPSRSSEGIGRIRGEIDVVAFLTIPAAQIQSDYAQTNSSAVDYIKNKPELPFEDKGQYLLETTPANKRSIEFTTLIGGTCGVNQLADIDSSSWTSNGLTVTATNGRIQVSGTADNTSTFSLFPSVIFNKLKLIKNHKYMLYINGTHNFNDFYYGIYGDITQTVNLSSSTIFVCNADNVTDSEIIASATANESYTADFYFYVIDLTAYFGSTIADDKIINEETAKK